MGEFLDIGLPSPASIIKWNLGYSICWLIDGYFGTKQGKEYLNDIIARLFLTMPSISERLLFEPREYTDKKQIHKLKDFWPLVEKAKKHKVGISHNSVGKDAIFVALKVWVELRIQEQGKGRTVPYSLLESFAFSMFEDKAKDKSTLKAKCRSIWNWYEERGWKNTKYLKYEKKNEREVMATRQEQIKKARKALQEQKKEKVYKAIVALKFFNEKITARNVAEHAGVAINTSAKYIKEWENENK